MKILFLVGLILTLLSFPLSASIRIDESITEEDAVFLSSCFEKAIGGRRDAFISISSLEREDGVIRLLFYIEGEERSITASSMEELESFIMNALSLEPHVFLDGSTLFYVTDDIIASHDDYGRGELVEAYDRDGKRRALMEVTDSMDGINLYSSIYEKDLLAGLSLEKGPSFSLALRALSSFSFSSFSFALDFSYLSFLPYFNPMASLYMSYDGMLSYYGGLGFEVRLPLERLIKVHFTLIEDASIIASAMLYLGYDGAFSVQSGFSVSYEHHMTSRLYWRLGYETGTIIPNTLMLSMGVMF